MFIPGLHEIPKIAGLIQGKLLLKFTSPEQSHRADLPMTILPSFLGKQALRLSW